LDDNYDKLEDEEINKIISEINNFANFEIININTLKEKVKQELKVYLSEILLKRLEELKASIKEEDFFDFEKRLFLQSIDELWMRHIDDMAHLREEVAFE
jgi:preprotein translocase subunit SecA